MFRFFAAVVLALPVMAKADIIVCQFTEPFVTTSLSMSRNSLTVVDNVVNTKKVNPEVSLQIMAPGKFQILSRNKALLMDLTLDFKGGDGMSQIVYPYSAVFYGDRTLRGGCTSNFLKATGN